MNVSQTKLEGVLVIEPKKFGDERGFFSEVFRESILSDYGFDRAFIQDNHAFSQQKGVLRGLHYQSPPFAQDKLVRVTRGAILDVAVDIREGSPTYGEWVSEVISAENWKQILVPRGFAHGYVTLKENTEVLYKVTEYYAPQADKGLMWNDSTLAIDWQLGEMEPILSQKDKEHPLFNEFKTEFT
jgi:dTDP-4-dehydrorhamnose 3,5-epimerase